MLNRTATVACVFLLHCLSAFSHPGKTVFSDGHRKSSDGSYHYHVPGTVIETYERPAKLVPYEMIAGTNIESADRPGAVKISFGSPCAPLESDTIQLRPVTDVEWAFACADWGQIGNSELTDQAKKFIEVEEQEHYRYAGVSCPVRKRVVVAKCKYAQSCVFCNPELEMRALIIKRQLEEAVEKNLDAAASARVRASYTQSQADIAGTLADKNEEEVQDRIDENTKFTARSRTTTIDGNSQNVEETEFSQSISMKDVKQFRTAERFRSAEKILQEQAAELQREANTSRGNADEVQFQMFRYINMIRKQLGREKAQLYYSN